MTDHCPFTKEDYRAAKRAEAVAESAMKATAEWRAHDAAARRVEEIADSLGEYVSTCEACLEPVFEDEPYSHDAENGVTLCEGCSPTWDQLLAEPEGFYRIGENGDPVYFTAETARAAYDQHIAEGGKPGDKFCLIEPETEDD
jgi:hypothetical protein